MELSTVSWITTLVRMPARHPYESPEDVDRSNGTLVMATNAEFEPYEYHEGDDIVGIDADIAQAICDKLGYELKIEDMEFDCHPSGSTVRQSRLRCSRYDCNRRP